VKAGQKGGKAMRSKSFIMDMDGVIVTGNQLIETAKDFIDKLLARDIKFLILTNNSLFTSRDLQHRLNRLGLALGEKHIYTSALATAQFLQWQNPNGTAFVLGESGLTSALHEAGYVLTDENPDYVVLGEVTSYHYEKVMRAVQLLQAGSRFIATNPDPSGPTERGLAPATGALAALIEKASGVSPYFVGKPNPLMMRTALRHIGEHSETTMMIGDRMDTDIKSGTEAGMETTLVLTGVTTASMVGRFPYRPTYVCKDLSEIRLDE
jgi:NagD protein